MLEALLISVLFVYPGAFLDVCAARFTPYAYGKDRKTELERAAQYFIDSAAITGLSILTLSILCGEHMETFGDVIAYLMTISHAIQYMLLSLTISIAYFWVKQYLLHRLPTRFGEDHSVKRVHGCELVYPGNAWRELLYGKELEVFEGSYIVRITQGGESVAGFAQFLPSDFEDGILLTQTEYVKKQMEKEAKGGEQLIGDPYYCYFDPGSGAIVEIFDGAPSLADLEA